MATALGTRERRDFSRIALRRPALLECAGKQATCEVVDLSLRGALVKVSRAFSPRGRTVALVVHLDPAGDPIRMRCTVAHRQGDTLGLCCREVDLDGLAHLRRMLEVNLGDERLLHRELAALLEVRARPQR